MTSPTHSDYSFSYNFPPRYGSREILLLATIEMCQTPNPLKPRPSQRDRENPRNTCQAVIRCLGHGNDRSATRAIPNIANHGSPGNEFAPQAGYESATCSKALSR